MVCQSARRSRRENEPPGVRFPASAAASQVGWRRAETHGPHDFARCPIGDEDGNRRKNRSRFQRYAGCCAAGAQKHRGRFAVVLSAGRGKKDRIARGILQPSADSNDTGFWIVICWGFSIRTLFGLLLLLSDFHNHFALCQSLGAATNRSGDEVVFARQSGLHAPSFRVERAGREARPRR
jgi:hypothetical protein